MTVAAGVGEPLQHDDAGALGPARAVGAVTERLGPAVGSEPALPAELGEHARGGHHGDAAGQRQRALPRAQRPRREVQRDQRGGARGVDGDRRALQAEGVRDPPGQARGGGVGADPERRFVHEQVAVVLAVRAHEHPDRFAVHRGRHDPGAFERLPGDLQQDALLGVHRQRVLGRDAEEVRVELVRPGQEAAVGGDAGRQVPAAVGGDGGDGVRALGHQSPQLLG